MADDTKKYCVTHHFYYSGEECPFCASERVHALDRRFNKSKNTLKKDTEKKEKSKEITQEDLEKLKDKFNSK